MIRLEVIEKSQNTETSVSANPVPAGLEKVPFAELLFIISN